MEKSYSAKVKEELLSVIPSRKRLVFAELFAIILLITEAKDINPFYILEKLSLDEGLYNKCFTLLKKINILNEYDKNKKQISDKSITDFLTKINMYKEEDFLPIIDSILTENEEIRSFLRGAFLVSGSITDPLKGYHFEILLKSDSLANIIIKAFYTFNINAKLAERQERFLVYVKDSDKISDVLGLMGAFISMLDFENVRAKKEFNNLLNRKVNCETANIGKMVKAVVRELNDIDLISETMGLDALPEKLKETAILRRKYPEISLLELGKLHNPRVGKSGVNHRLRKLNQIASDIKNREEL